MGRTNLKSLKNISEITVSIVGELDLDAALAKADCVVVVTDHSCYDWAAIQRQASVLVDTQHAVN